MDYSLPDSFSLGIFYTRILDWIVSSPGDLPDPEIEHMTPSVTPDF